MLNNMCIIVIGQAVLEIFHFKVDIPRKSREIRNSLTISCIFLLEFLQGPNSENCLVLVFCKKMRVIFASDEKYITYAIRKFMLDMPSPGRFQNIGL